MLALALFRIYLSFDQRNDIILVLVHDRVEVRAAAIFELVSSDRHCLSNLEEDVVGHDIGPGLVLDPGQVVSIFQNCLQHRQLLRRVMDLVSLQDHLVVEVFDDVLLPYLEADRVALVHSHFEQIKLV